MPQLRSDHLRLEPARTVRGCRQGLRRISPCHNRRRATFRVVAFSVRVPRGKQLQEWEYKWLQVQWVPTCKHKEKGVTFVQGRWEGREEVEKSRPRGMGTGVCAALHQQPWGRVMGGRPRHFQRV